MKDAEKKSGIIIPHRGPLTTASLDKCLPLALFRARSNPKSKKERKRDPYHMGWEYAPVGDIYHFEIIDLPFATAEGVVTLAALVECLRQKENSDVSVEISEKARAWSNGLQLGQIIRGNWLSVNRFPMKFSRPGGYYSFPLWKEVVSDKNSCHNVAERLARQVELVLADLKHAAVSEVAYAAKSVFEEALLNVLEHAYDSDQQRTAFGALTITPVPRDDQLAKYGHLAKEEVSWFKHFVDSGLMLEIAVADFGRNIPFTLWHAYEKETPQVLEELPLLRLGTTSGRVTRAKLHHQIALWAFNHRSTRKKKEEFSSELAFLNWRGLHRAMNTAAKLSGCMVIRSGQARTGYAFQEDSTFILEPPNKTTQHEFPGTSIVLRIPIPKARSVPRLTSRNLSDSAERSALEIKTVSKPSTIQSESHLLAGRPTMFAIANPFQTLRDDEVVSLLQSTLSLSPHIIPIHFFLNIEPPAALSQLSSFDDSRLGPPRLIAFWKADRRLMWRLVGVMPNQVRSIVESLEEKGTATIGVSAISKRFCETLARSYSPFVETRDGEICLVPFDKQPSTQVIHGALQHAFEEWAQTNKKNWLFDEPGKLVRLPTGRLISRYVSVYKLIESDDFFARELGRQFSSILRDLQREYKDLSIVTDSEASYFIARMLLQDFKPAPEIHVANRRRGIGPAHPTLVFIDAIHKGDTLRTLVRRTKQCVRVICCIDLRDSGAATDVSFHSELTALLTLPFDPGEVLNENILADTSILEVDAVTHIPQEAPSIEVLSLGTDKQRDDFINSNSHLFQYGLQQRPARIDVVRMPVEQLVSGHKDQLLDWIQDAVSRELAVTNPENSSIDVVVFTRNEASIRAVVGDLGDRLCGEKRFNINRVFKAVLLWAPSGSREIFSRLTPALVHGLEQIAGNQSLFSEAPKDFLALYLDDACVTGKSLVNFLNRVSIAAHQQLPKSILAVPVLSRFSPAEETFYSNVCQFLSARNTPRQIRFSFSPQFRLQIRSFERIESTPAYQLFLKLAANTSWLDARLSGYLQQVEQNFREMTIDVNKTESPLSLNCHPFYGGTRLDTEPPSSRTVRIRHLMALQEQNIGVLSILLHEVLEACKEKDYTLLRMLALEPSLIDSSPLNKGVRHDITQLAIRSICSDSAAPTKSDGLCVLAQQGQVLVDRLNELLPAIGQDDDLINQLLLFLFASKTLGSMWYGDVGTALQEVATELPIATYNYLQSWLQSFDEITEQRPVLSEHEARLAISTLISHTAYHGIGLDKLNALSDWVYSRESERSRKDGGIIQTTIFEVVTFFRDIVLPGIDGLAWWAEFRKLDTRAAAALNLSFRRLIPFLNQLSVLAQTLAAGPIGPTMAQEMEELWESIRSRSIASQADTFLSKLSDVPDEDIPALEYWAPKFFCLPKEIVSGLASNSLLQVEVTTTWELADQEKAVLAVPFPLEQVYRVFSLVIQDMRNHGSKTGNRVHLSIHHKDGISELTVSFENRARKQDTPRKGQSQNLARQIAREYGFELRAGPPVQAGQIYRLLVIFPNALYLKWS